MVRNLGWSGNSVAAKTLITGCGFSQLALLFEQQPQIVECYGDVRMLCAKQRFFERQRKTKMPFGFVKSFCRLTNSGQIVQRDGNFVSLLPGFIKRQRAAINAFRFFKSFQPIE